MPSSNAHALLALTTLLFFSGCASRDSSPLDPDPGASTGFADDESGDSTGEVGCGSAQPLDPGALLPDGRTLEEFREAWAGPLAGGVDWDAGVSGVSVEPYGGVSMGSIELREVSGAWWVEREAFSGACETQVEVESELVVVTTDGALDVVVPVRWTYDDGWSSNAVEIALGGDAGALEEIGLPNGESSESLNLQAVLLEPGVVAGQFFSSTSTQDALEVFGVGGLGGTRSPSDCGAFDAMPPGCRAAGCFELVGTPVVVDVAGTCQCRSERAYCLSGESAPAEPALFHREGTQEDVARFDSAVGHDEGWESCAMVQGVAACACGVECEG